MLLRLAALFASACLTAPSAYAAGNAIVIGQVIDLSGPNGAVGRDYVAGIKTCFDAVNAAGGINGRRILFVAHDDHGDPATAAAMASELVERDQAEVLFGGIGDDSVRAVTEASAVKRSGLMLYAPLAESDGTPPSRVLFWRPAYKQELRQIFSHFSKLGIASVAVAYQDTPAGAQAYRALQAELRERKMTLTGTARIAASGQPLPGDAARLAAGRPGFVVVAADTIGTALFLKEYRRHDGQTFVAGTSLTNLETLREIAGARAVEWTVFSQVVPNPAGATSLLQIEHLNMMRKYRDETVSSLTLEGYAAAKALVKALQLSARPRQALQEFLAQPRDIDLGGMTVATGAPGNRLSGYLDIALFRKGGGLAF